MDKVNIITSVLSVRHGGRTKALLDRAKLLAENNIEVNIYTSNYNSNYHKIINKYRKNNLINNNVKIYNIYDYYKIDNSYKRNNFKTILAQELKELHPKLKLRRQNIFKKFISILGNKNKYEKIIELELLSLSSEIFYKDKNGKLIFKINRNKILMPLSLEVYDINTEKVVLIAHIDAKLNVDKICLHNKDTGLVESELFYDAGFNKYFEVKYSQNQKNEPLEYILYRANKDPKIFKRSKSFYTYYYNQIFNDGDIVVNDARLLDYCIMNCKKNIKVIYQLHSNHQETNAKKFKVRKSFNYLLKNNHKERDKIILLTEHQKEDILKLYPHLENNLVVISHAIEKKKIKANVNNKQICMIARLVPEKNIPDAIKAFSIFDQTLSGYRFLIYGDGEKKEELEKLIKDNNLQDKVILKGYSKDVDKIYKTSRFSIMTSKYEGFSLAVLESIANGCPVISYDVDYGPKDMINKISGIVVDKNTPETLAEAMIEETKKNRDRNKIAKTITQFSKDKFISSWLDLIKELSQ